jgi:hypothetical protein
MPADSIQCTISSSSSYSCYGLNITDSDESKYEDSILNYYPEVISRAIYSPHPDHKNVLSSMCGLYENPCIDDSLRFKIFTATLTIFGFFTEKLDAGYICDKMSSSEQRYILKLLNDIPEGQRSEALPHVISLCKNMSTEFFRGDICDLISKIPPGEKAEAIRNLASLFQNPRIKFRDDIRFYLLQLERISLQQISAVAYEINVILNKSSNDIQIEMIFTALNLIPLKQKAEALPHLFLLFDGVDDPFRIGPFFRVFESIPEGKRLKAIAAATSHMHGLTRTFPRAMLLIFFSLFTGGQIRRHSRKIILLCEKVARRQGCDIILKTLQSTSPRCRSLAVSNLLKLCDEVPEERSQEDVLSALRMIPESKKAHSIPYITSLFKGLYGKASKDLLSKTILKINRCHRFDILKLLSPYICDTKSTFYRIALLSTLKIFPPEQQHEAMPHIALLYKDLLTLDAKAGRFNQKDLTPNSSSR